MAGDHDTSELGQAVQDVTERASLLIREEIELAKREMTEKVTKLIKGAVVGIVAGIFAVFGLIYLLHAASWAIWDLIGGRSNFWLGFIIVAALLFLLGGLAGFVATRFLKRGSPPTPQMAIEEGKLIKETVTGTHPAMPQGPTTETRTKVPR
ncbi:MAG: phage holin family protein [Actinomycetota bacterium]|nr:phage holin family protein [Actinomycetota bacterium]